MVSTRFDEGAPFRERGLPRSVQKLTNNMATGTGLNLFLLIFSVVELLTLKILGGTYVSPRTSPQPGAPARA